jgi:hypothetical protein
MRNPAHSVAVLAFCFPLFFVPWQRAAAHEGAVIYDVRQGSLIMDDCLFCDRAPIWREVRGSFELVADDSGLEFAVEHLELRDDGGDYVIRGSGSYRQSFASEPLQEMALVVEVNGIPGIRLTSGKSKIEAPWPAIEIEATEAEPHDEFHVYTLRLVAAPRVKLVPYELLPGSFLIEDCLPCGRPTIPVPITGKFLLGEIAGSPNPISTYRLDAADFRSAAKGRDYRVQGAGYYRQGGEVALLQSMELRVDINDVPQVHLASGSVTVEMRFPELEIRLEHQDPPTPFQVFSLHLMARPAEAPGPLYRRGDSNADGKVDVSDPVFFLRWHFAGGPRPPCLDAADANDDDELNITDAVFVLLYLFRGGAPLPPPGAEECGRPPPNAFFGCTAYPACE